MARRLLVLSGGHPFDADGFDRLLAGLEGWTVEHLSHPEAEGAVADGAAGRADALLFYDMPGYSFADGAVTARPPSAGFRSAVAALLAKETGVVAMHHALAGWAAWPEWAELVGGRFLYQPGKVRGRPCLDSGYRHDVAYQAEVVAEHPVTAGLPATFAVTDELYLAEIFEDTVLPLVRARHAFTAGNFYSAAYAVAGRMFDNQGWAHPDGGNLIAWAKRAGGAPLVYLQPGDGPVAWENPHVRRLLANALDWVASDAARAWAGRAA